MRCVMFILTALMLTVVTLPSIHAADQTWIAVSNGYTNQVLTIEMKHHPEQGTRQGLSQYDALVSQPTLADEDQERKEKEEVIAKLKSALPQQKQKEVAQDLAIIIQSVELGFRQEDYERVHDVPFLNASSLVYSGIRSLLDDQTPAERRPAAVARLRKYAGLEPGYQPITEVLKQRVSSRPRNRASCIQQKSRLRPNCRGIPTTSTALPRFARNIR